MSTFRPTAPSNPLGVGPARPLGVTAASEDGRGLLLEEDEVWLSFACPLELRSDCVGGVPFVT